MAFVVMHFNFELNQALAGCGVLATSAAVFAWSCVLIRSPVAWRVIGLLGAAVGLVAASLFVGGHLQLNVHGFGLFLFAQALCMMAVGVRLALRR